MKKTFLILPALALAFFIASTFSSAQYFQGSYNIPGSGIATNTVNNFTTNQNIILNNLSNTVVAGLTLTNSTAATTNLQQNSPALFWFGNGYKTTATAASQPVGFGFDTLPVQGSANPSGLFNLISSINGTLTTNFQFGSDGSLTFLGNSSLVGAVSSSSLLPGFKAIRVPALAVENYNMTIGSSVLTLAGIETDGSGVSDSFIINKDGMYAFSADASDFTLTALRVAIDTYITRKSAGTILVTSNLIAVGQISATNGFATYTNNAVAPVAITYPNSDALWTNTFGINISLYIDNSGVTGTTTSINGGQIYSSLIGDVKIDLNPGDYFASHYTIGTPTAKWRPR